MNKCLLIPLYSQRLISLEPVNLDEFNDYESFQTFVFIGVDKIEDHCLKNVFIWLHG